MEYAPQEANAAEDHVKKKKPRVKIGDDPSMRDYMLSIYENEDIDKEYQELILSETTKIKKLKEHDSLKREIEGLI